MALFRAGPHYQNNIHMGMSAGMHCSPIVRGGHVPTEEYSTFRWPGWETGSPAYQLLWLCNGLQCWLLSHEWAKRCHLHNHLGWRRKLIPHTTSLFCPNLKAVMVSERCTNWLTTSGSVYKFWDGQMPIHLLLVSLYLSFPLLLS